jgi:hypothetical protein
MKDEKRAADDGLLNIAAAIEDLAFLMPAPNAYTPQFVALANAIKWQAALSARADGGKGEAVGVLTVSRYRGINGMVNTDFEYLGDLPDGSYHCYTVPQAECAPREAQPEPESACNPADICAGCRCEYSQSAAPTPERADAEKDAALGDIAILEIADRFNFSGINDEIIDFARAILAR